MSHRHDAHAVGYKAGAAVITVSSTRTPVNDTSGAAIERAFERAGVRVLIRTIVKDDLLEIRRAVGKALSMPGVDVVVTAGGTGMGAKDVTVEAVRPLLEKHAEGWGDVFRAISTAEIGTGAFLSRSIAGTAHGKWVVCIPGSEGAARTAVERILIPELEHMLWEVRR